MTQPRLKHLLKMLQRLEEGATKDVIAQIHLILEWFYEMIDDVASCDNAGPLEEETSNGAGQATAPAGAQMGD